MSLKKWCTSFINCFKSANTGLKEYSDNNNSEYFFNLLKFLYESFWKDLPYIILQDIIYNLWLIFNDDKTLEIINDTNKKIVIVIPWFWSTTGILPKVKDRIKKEWYNCIPIDNRIWFHNLKKIQRKTIRDILNVLSNNQWKDIVLFWYSYWWWIAHIVWDKHNIPQVTYWTPTNSSDAPFWVWANYYGIEMKKYKGKWSNQSIDIVEEFSFANPFPWDRKIVNWTLSHFSPNSKKWLDIIIDSINSIFEKAN